MKKILLITTLIFLSTLLSFRVLADGPVSGTLDTTSPTTNASTDPYESDQAPVIQDVEGLRAEFRQYIQDPESKEIKFEMILKSGIDSDRVKITWTMTGASGFLEEFPQSKNISVQNGKSYSIPITIKPVGRGVTELRAKAEAFKAENTYLVSVRKNFASNADREILPITSDYSQFKLIATLKNIFIVITILVLILVALLFGFRNFAKWLNRDDRK